MKILLQFIALLVLFLGTYFGLSRVNWVSVFKVEKISRTSEEKLGDLLWETISSSEKTIEDPAVTQPVDSLVRMLCKANKIKRQIKVKVLQSDELNAFALPGNYMVVYTGLIEACDHESELLGVLGHEIAHMEKRHVMKKLAKEMGLTVLISAGSGGKGTAVIREALKVLSSTAYDRRLEQEADRASVAYLLKAGADPEGLAFILEKIALLQASLPEYTEWLSTHPDTDSRIQQIRESLKGKQYSKNDLVEESYWKSLKTAVTGEQDTTTSSR
jgi:beta-barrel assembly-enhancing protease